MKSLLPTLMVLVLLAGCNSQPARQADIVIESAHSGGSALGMSPDSKTLVSGGWSGFLRLWDMESGKELGKWRAHTDSVNGIFFIDNQRFITAGYDGRVVIWNRSGTELASRNTTKITSVAVDLSQDLLLTGHKNGNVTHWQLSTLEEQLIYQPHKKLVRSLAISNNGELFASSATDTRVALIERDSGTIRYVEEPPTDPRTLAFSPDDNFLLGGGWFKLFRWTPGNGKLTVLDTEHKGIINNIEFTPDGQLASISRQTDSAVLVLDPIDGSTSKRYQQHDLCGVAVNVSRDGRFMATTSDDASVRIWDLKN